jgi:nucleoside-diphosphate-sugar epimerase
MRALVTGAVGFIGSHLGEALLDRGDEVAVVDHLRRTPRPWLSAALARGARLHVADVRDLGAVRQAFAPSGPTSCCTSPRRSTSEGRSPTRRSTCRSNVAGTVFDARGRPRVRGRARGVRLLGGRVRRP